MLLTKFSSVIAATTLAVFASASTLAAGVDLIANSKVWLESDAVDQLQRLAALPGFQRAVGLPDLHPGAGTPIGAAVATEGHLHPTLLGSDAGCGSGQPETELRPRRN